ncbi:hypothetical protein M3Y95_01060700 [Aphelenchoides besseyi]|nr:hypothetical protein M3Y95_01060700 [Aphelenchoides besseyi]
MNYDVPTPYGYYLLMDFLLMAMLLVLAYYLNSRLNHRTRILNHGFQMLQMLGAIQQPRLPLSAVATRILPTVEQRNSDKTGEHFVQSDEQFPTKQARNMATRKKPT